MHRNPPAAMEPCPVADNPLLIKRAPELRDKHALQPWAGKGELGEARSGLSCKKCHKTWEHINVSAVHIRTMATHDIEPKHRRL